MAAPAQRLKRVFVGAAIRIAIEKCEKCGGKVKVIACIEDPEVIEKILKHLGLDEASEARTKCHRAFSQAMRIGCSVLISSKADYMIDTVFYHVSQRYGQNRAGRGIPSR